MGRVVRLPGLVPARPRLIEYDRLGPGEREQVDALIADFHRDVQRNPLMGFDPFYRRDGAGGQVGYLEASKALKAGRGGVTVKMGVAGNQAGKTEIGVVDDLIQCLDRDVLPERLKRFKQWDPPFKCRIVTMDLGSSLYQVLIPKWQRLCPVGELTGGTWETGFDKTLRILSFKNGSQVQFMSAEQPREKHQGATLDRVRFDEEPPPPNGWGIYRESRMRVIARQGEIAFNMTPSLLGGGLTWTYDEVWLKRDDADTFVGQWSMRDNPYLPPEAVEVEMAKCTTEAERRARIEGDFVSFRGRVFEEFNHDDHVIGPVKAADLADMDVVIGYDPGLTRGGVVWVAFDGDNDMLVFDELYPQNLSVETIVNDVRAKNRFWSLTGMRDPLWIVDPAQRIRDMVTAKQSVSTELARLGVSAAPGENDRLTGFLALKGRFEQKRIRITSNCTSLLRELDRLLVAADEDTQENRPRSTAKGHTFATIGPDHLVDPLRYVTLSRTWTAERGPVLEERRGYQRDFAPSHRFLVPTPSVGPFGPMS